jgi:hypothetical protein
MDIQRISDEFSSLVESEPSLLSGKVEPSLRLWKNISRWLDIVLFHTCTFIPSITEKNAYNLALAHPLSIWLFKYADIIDEMCTIGMQMTKEFENIPITLIRLPQLTARYRKFLLPIVEKFNEDSIEEMKEAMPEYLELRGISQEIIQEK